MSCFLSFLACFFCITSFGQKVVSKTDSLWFADMTGKINASINENPTQADSLAKAYFTKAKKLQNDEYIGKGACLVQMGASVLEPKQAKAWYDTATLYLQRSKNYLWNGYLNRNYGIILTNHYSFESGLDYLNKSVFYFEKIKDTTQLLTSYSTVSGVFHDFGDYEKGKKYAVKGLEIWEKQKEKSETTKWYLLNALAINYDDNKEYDKAIETHLKALKFATDNDHFLTSTYNNLGNTHKKKGNFPEAEKYLKKSFELSRKVQNDYQFATVYGNLGDLAIRQKKYQNAQKYLDSSLYYSKKSESPEKLKDAYEYSSDLYEKIGDYKKTLLYLRQFLHLKDSLESVQKAGIIYDAQERYETAKKEKENHDLQVANHLKTIEKEKAVSEKRIVMMASFAVIGLLSLMAFLLYRNRLGKIKRNEEQKTNQALFEGEQNERIRIARDLHDGVGQMLSLVKMNLSSLPKNNENENIQNLVDKTIDEVRNVSHNLIPEELNFGIFAALENLADKVNASNKTKMKIHIPEEIRQIKFQKQNELSIYRIVQEVVNNMVKHAEASRIDFSISKLQNSFIINIKDNGKGMENLAVENSKGIGWKNIDARVRLLDGKLKIESEKLIGTQIEITLPQNG